MPWRRGRRILVDHSPAAGSERVARLKPLQVAAAPVEQMPKEPPLRPALDAKQHHAASQVVAAGPLDAGPLDAASTPPAAKASGAKSCIRRVR